MRSVNHDARTRPENLVEGYRLPLTSRSRAVIAAVATVGLTLAGLVTFVAPVSADVPAPPAQPETVSADPLPTVQIDGVAWRQEIVGNTVYVGGSFANARPAGAAPGTSLSPRANLLAYNLQTGELITNWAPTTNSDVHDISVSPDGSRLYIAGSFSQVSGQTRYRVAAFSTATGALLSSWAPVVNGRVDAIKATDSTVYFTGEFTSVGGAARTKVAAVTASTGAVLPFNATVEGGYGGKGIEISPDGGKVVFDGSFTAVNGSTNPGRGIAALDSNTGASLPWLMNSVLRDGGGAAAFMSLDSDGDSVYGTGFDYGGTAEDGFEGSFRANWSDGSLVWMEDCHGDSYDVAAVGDVVYTASHAHYCGNIGGYPETNPRSYHHTLAFSKAPTGPLITADPLGYRSFTGQQAPSLLHWFPTWDIGTYTGISQAAWTVTGNSEYVLYGGEFPKVLGVKQQGLVRFATKAIAPNKVGPRDQSTGWVLNATSVRQGQVRLSWLANHDPDDPSMHYSLYRRDLGTSTPIYQTDAVSNFWTKPRMSFNDRAVTAGQTYQYLIRATDPHGNTTTSEWTSITATTGTPGNAYNDSVLNDDPSYYWPLGEGSGTTAFDWSNGNDLTLTSNVTRNVAGPNQSVSSTASQFPGSGSASGSSSTEELGPQTFTVEAWFKTTSSAGGKIVGFGSAQTGDSGSYDRQLYIDSSGHVVFGVYPGGIRTVASPSSYRDGAWHHAVGELSSAGQVLYVDGVRAGVRTDTTSAQPYNGYWRVGGDSLGSWPGAGSGYLNGSISDVAVYDHALSRDAITAHWSASGRTSTVPSAPTDSYGKAVYDLDPELYWRFGESTGSTAADSGRNNSPGSYSGKVNKGAVGAVAGTLDTAAQFAPTKNIFGTWSPALVASQRSYANPLSYAIEAWFKTTTTAGGKIVGFGDSANGLSSNYDRHIYMNPDGTVTYGVWTGSASVLSSTAALNNGQWHHVVGEQSAAGMRFYVDGILVGSNSNAVAQDYTGYWRVGGDNGWSGAPWFTGTIDEVAIYNTPLSDAQVLAHFSLGKFGSPNLAPIASFTSSAQALDVSFDASGSNDPDGLIARYAWDFGDGTSGVGVSPTHRYPDAGPRTVTLTVTDDRGGVGTMQQSVNPRLPNVNPVAAFTATPTFLKVDADGSSSSDPDGAIATYAWSYGDGSSGTGVTSQHTYAAPGTYTITLTVTDDRGGSNATSFDVTVSGPPNVPPAAAFTSSTNNLKASFTSTSADSDGVISSQSWAFGDGATALGATAEHTYASAGTFTVTLTVTDDKGASTQISHDVVTTAPPPFVVVESDAFNRTSSSGWGSADVGGPWSLSGAASSFSVGSGSGTIGFNKYDTRGARLSGNLPTSAIVTTTFSVNRTGAGFTVDLIGRQVGSSDYSARIRFEDPSTMRLYLLRGETAIGSSVVLPGPGYVAGQKLTLKISVTGTGPTTLAAKLWRSADPEPSTWQLTGTDSTAGLQTAGIAGIEGYLGGSSATATAALSVGSFDAIDPTTGTPQPLPNVAPTAQFTANATNLVTSFTSSSYDPDGSIASQSWAFGDGETGSGASVTHTYAAAGTYTATLTVTDDKGAAATATATVTVTAAPTPPAGGALVADDFERAVANGWGTADVGGPWSTTGGASSFSVGNGVGTIALAPSATRGARLESVSTATTLTQLQLSSDAVMTGGAMNVTVVGRQVGTSNYSGRVRFEANGSVRLYVLRDETALTASYVLPGVTYTAGTTIRVSLAVTGNAPTTVAFKAWLDGTAEPAGWQIQATDATPAMQAPGSVGVLVSLSGASTLPSARVSIDNVRVSAG